ncbi:unnamed protein product [Cuscuta campestris]|uniref:N-acetyltransferase domain-containing protein n=2 Tax=Cuscuta sect. Cleistogrammica TaxID=1824901 RepID=A0A484LP09_9ASTE|nr:hypothetical protein DM860_003169 [Cuscuta australis]VFQ78263.1 unnamed protein product [Cuscuta campestris]
MAAAFTYHPKPHHHLLHRSADSFKKPSFRPRPSPPPPGATASSATIPTMAEIMESCRARNLDLQLRSVGPFFRVTARNMRTQNEVGWAQGVTRVWFGGRILHLDSIRMGRETVGMEKSIFGIGVFVGAVAIRHGYDSGCTKAELLAINDSHLYHSKLVRFYKRIGFKVVHEVKGESLGDIGHMLVWGGIGTRMDANLEDLLIKWGPKFKPIGLETGTTP